MKLKLFFLSILALLTIIAYQKYSEYTALKSIDSYQECRSQKSSNFTSTIPSFCITKLGTTFVESTPDSTPAILPIPTSYSWKRYYDFSTSHSQFSFEYPDFMPEPSIYWRNESVKMFISSYAWQVDSLNVGSYVHDIDLRITGPYPDTEGSLLVEWIKEQGWPSQEGKTQEMAGHSRVIYKNVGSQKVVHTTFIENGVDYPRSWTLFFKVPTGIYRIDLAIQGTPEELSKYQNIFPQIISTLKFNTSHE